MPPHQLATKFIMNSHTPHYKSKQIMKQTITTLFVIILLAAGSIQAQTKPAAEPVKSEVKQENPAADVFRAELKAEEKEAVLNILNSSKITILRSSNSNTTEQNLQLIRGIEDVMKLINERFQKVAEPDKDKPKKQ